MADVVDILWTRTWWSWQRDWALPGSVPYHVFNLFEGTAWVVFCGLVLWRRARGRRTALELWYALAFFSFGLTDFREAFYQQSWLIWVKVVNLLVLFYLRRRVIQTLYPGSRLY
jgi:hypothetical protein